MKSIVEHFNKSVKFKSGDQLYIGDQFKLGNSVVYEITDIKIRVFKYKEIGKPKSYYTQTGEISFAENFWNYKKLNEKHPK